MKPIDVLRYIGKPYSDTGDGPDEFNCWGLLRYIQKNEFGRDLPVITIGDAEETRRIHNESLCNADYVVVSEPIHGDCVLLRGGDCPHVGVYLEIDGGGVLHSLGGVGVVWTPMQRLNSLGYSRRVYYRVRDARSIYPTERPVPPDD